MADDTKVTEAPKSEQEANKKREQVANEDAQQRAKRLQQEREEQQRAAGQKPDDDPKPLSKTDNVGGKREVEIAGEKLQLSGDEETHLRTLPSIGTVEDPAGIERVVVPDLNASGWKPAPVEPDPVEVARLENLQKALDAKKTERLEQLKVS